MDEIMKSKAITNAKISFVSLVDKAANKQKFIIAKGGEDGTPFNSYGPIIKVDKENHYVTGIVYEPMTKDAHDNYMTEDEIQKAAYWFAKNGDKVDIQHSFEACNGCAVVETFVAKSDMKIDKQAIKKGTWLMTVEISDKDVWEKIVKGEITGFSMGGVGAYSTEDVDLTKVKKGIVTVVQSNEKKGLIKKLAETFGFDVVEKGEMKERFSEKIRGIEFWNAFDTLRNLLGTSRWDSIQQREIYAFESDENKIIEALQDFGEIITSLLIEEKDVVKAIAEAPRGIEKAGRKLSSANKGKLIAIRDSINEFAKEFDEEEPEEEKPEQDKEKRKPALKGPAEPKKQDEVEAACGSKNEGKVKKQEDSDMDEKTVQALIKDMSDIKKALNIESAEVKTGNDFDEIVKRLDAIEKAIAPAQEPTEEDIKKAAEELVSQVLKSKGVSTNLNSEPIHKEESPQHYLHGVL